MHRRNINEVYANSGLGKWFGKGGKGGTSKGGWDRYNTKGEKIGKCGDKSEGEGKPKCLSANKAAKMSKKDIAKAVRRKREADPDTDRPGTGNKPINVSNRIGEGRETMKSFKHYINEKNVPTDPKKWAAATSAARSKFDVYPSAYANAWAAKKYKADGGGWRKSNESIEEKMDPTDHVKKKNGKYCVYNKDGKIVKEFDNKKEADAYAIKNHEKLMLREACWDSHMQKGMKMKGGKMVPNCVPRNEESNELDEKSAAWQRKAGKNKEGGLNAAGRRSYERENPGSDLKAPVSAKTASKNPDGKAAGRRKSFCARMGGMPGPMKDEKGKPTRKALALRKWDC